MNAIETGIESSLLIIGFYQRLISPLLPNRCRFTLHVQNIPNKQSCVMDLRGYG